MHPIIKTVIQRLALGVLTLIVVSIIIFLAIEMLPGDFATATLGQAATPETVKAFRLELGLDHPAHVRYFEWIFNVVQGDFGTSFSGRSGGSAGATREVADLIAPRLYNTLFLAGITAVVAIPMSIGLGLLAALYRNSWYDRTINAVTLTAISLPDFLIAYILMLYLSVKFPIFPSLSNVSMDTPLVEHVVRSTLPAMTLTLIITAYMLRMTRAAIINLLANPYIEMARLKGVSRSQVILHHALPNAWAPIANIIAFNLAFLVVGVVVVETVFVYPGIGQLLVDAVSSRDIPVVQACALIFAATYIVLNLVADIISIITNPRLLHPR